MCTILALPAKDMEYHGKIPQTSELLDQLTDNLLNFAFLNLFFFFIYFLQTIDTL